MLRSMTGFGRCFLEEENWTQVWEVRSVNSRHLDLRWLLPTKARCFESVLEKVVKQFASRGRVEMSLNLQMHRQDLQGLSFNEEQADAMLTSLTNFATSRGDFFEADYNRFLSMSSFWENSSPEIDDTLGASLERGLTLAMEDWNESRVEEAKALEKDILLRLVRMEEWLACILERAPDIKEERFNLVQERLSEILEKHQQELDEGRFLQEIAIMADRLDVSEELTRLGVHFDRLRGLLAQGQDAGRKLDFTLQECFREVTTCGNKIQDMQVSRLVVDLKNELEKCREQCQNIE